MIDQSTIQKIYDTANIVEIIQDFITLKRAGVNYKGNCPFHNEKTPSFVVSQAKGIYKCFGCGVGGDAVKFVMEHEKISYPEALKYIAKKYHIEIVEKELTPEQQQNRQEKDSLFIVSEFAKNFFINSLQNTSEGNNIAMSYYKERGMSPETVKKFELGWSPEKRDALTSAALQKGYKLQYLEKTGLTIVKENYQFDRFAGRVIFPIHSLSGKVIGFGGRTLRNDKKNAKYLNSPESDIYHKSNTLYGIFFAKSSIVKLDKCIMVEGYTDVISLHQADVENVVASSGTSLTIEQIKLVRRFTKNLTVIYDGDPAGIKASLRGIDMILAEEMNVKVVLLPEGEDPDSYSQKLGSDDFKKYIEENEQDFIKFKTKLLMEDAENDPVKRASLVRDIVKSISVIPDIILRSTYIRECSSMMNIGEDILYKAMSKSSAHHVKQRISNRETVQARQTPVIPANVKGIYSENDEKWIIYYLLNFGNYIIQTDEETGEEESVAEFIISQMMNQDLEFINLIYKDIFHDYAEALQNNTIPQISYFLRHENEKIRSLSAEIASPQKELSQLWASRGASVQMPEERLYESVPDAIERYKLKIIQIRIKDIDEQIKTIDYENDMTKLDELLDELQELDKIKIELTNYIEKSVFLR